VTGTFLGRLKTREYDPETSLGMARAEVAAVPDLVIADASRVRARLLDHGRGAGGARPGHGRRRPHHRRQRALVGAVDRRLAARTANEYDRLNYGPESMRAISADVVWSVLATAERGRATMKEGDLNSSGGSRRCE
jgi:hypothetical protein